MPRSVVEAMATNEILQIVVFSMFFGVACAALGERAHKLVEGIEQLSQAILTITGYIMKLAPIAVFASMAAIVTTQGLGILVTYGKFVLEFYFGLALLWGLLVLVGYLFFGSHAWRLVTLVREPFLLAFSTASSEAAYPKMMEQLEKFPISKKIISFVLPMGYSFNLDGSMMYCTFATLFIAQAYNIELTVGHQITMLLLLMLTSKGMAGVPRASLVVIAATLTSSRYSGSGAAADHRYRPVPRHGTLRHQRDRQLARDRRGREMGGRDDTGNAARAGTGASAGLRRAMNRTGPLFGMLLALAFLPPATAQDVAVGALTGTLKQIKDSGTITLGYRESSLPFSYLNLRRQPIGYAIDLCREIVDEVSNALGREDITIAFAPVTSADRLDKVQSGAVDLECGSTTNNIERQKQVAFSPIFFIAGTKLMVPAGSAFSSYRDLAGKTAVVTAGTTNEAALRALSDKQNLGMTIVTARDHAESLSMLAIGKADAFATDDVLLYGFIATENAAKAMKVVGDYLSYDPYGLVYRRDDPGFAAIVERAFARMAGERRLAELYNKWFMRRLPTGEALNLPMSPQLGEIFRVLGQPD